MDRMDRHGAAGRQICPTPLAQIAEGVRMHEQELREHPRMTAEKRAVLLHQPLEISAAPRRVMGSPRPVMEVLPIGDDGYSEDRTDRVQAKEEVRVRERAEGFVEAADVEEHPAFYNQGLLGKKEWCSGIGSRLNNEPRGRVGGTCVSMTRPPFSITSRPDSTRTGLGSDD